MNFKGIEIEVKNKPVLEPNFLPANKFIEGYLKGATKAYAFAWERNDGNISKFDTFIYGSPQYLELDLFYLKYVIEFALYTWGGWKLYLCGDTKISQQLIQQYLNDPLYHRAIEFTQWAYGKELSYEILPYEQCPEKDNSQPIGRHLEGCRIGFDGGASDRKVSAVIDGEAVYSEEVLWYAKFEENIEYQYNEILTAFKTAAAKMPKVDAIGVSIAGIVTDGLLSGASILKMVPEEVMEKEGRNIFQRVAKEIGENIPLTMLNDGNVAALAGSMNSGENKLWGVAIGTSIGTGYVDAKGYLPDMMNEISVAKIAFNEDANYNENKEQKGVGESYFSQDCIIRHAIAAGLVFDEKLYPAQKLVLIQEEVEKGNVAISRIFENIGCCFAHTLPLVCRFLDIASVCLLGRVVSNKGGEIILAECLRVLKDEYPETASQINIWLPDEKQRRVSQSVAAASLPEIPKQ